MNTFYTYILHSSSKNSYYIGSCTDLDERLKRHNAGATPSTKYGRPWNIAYYEQFNSKSEAIKRELHIKKQKSRIYIKNLINSSAL